MQTDETNRDEAHTILNLYAFNKAAGTYKCVKRQENYKLVEVTISCVVAV